MSREYIYKVIERIRKNLEILLSNAEAYHLYVLARKVEEIEGDIAEVGVYNGGSARIIREASPNKNFHLFDTFAGMPPLTKVDTSPSLQQGMYVSNLEEVKKNLNRYKKVYYHPGHFPATSTPVESKKFSFVHLDVDLYESTLAALKFFYPRINAGGVILSHDYPNLIGVKRAFDEFFSDKKEIVIELYPCSQCMVVKA